MKTYTKSDFNRIWTWADTLCTEVFTGKKVGQMIEMDNMLQNVDARQIVLVGEFDLKKRHAQYANGNQTLANIGDVMTGRQWVLRCIAKEPDTITDRYGIPMVTKRGKARLKIVQIEG